MVGIELLAIILFIVLLWMYIKGNNGIREEFKAMTILFFVVSLFIIIFAPDTKPTSMEIVSIKRDTQIGGTFVLGFGSINERVVYYAYEKLGDDTYKLRTLGNTTIIETDNKKPSYVRGVKCLQGIFRKYCNHKEPIIYVPKGTIKKEFNL